MRGLFVWMDIHVQFPDLVGESQASLDPWGQHSDGPIGGRM